MRLKNILLNFVAVIVVFVAGISAERMGILNMSGSDFIRTTEPLLLNAGGDTKYYHLLPVGTALYKDIAFPEGHTRYIAYINIKDDFSHEKIHSQKINLVSPIWAYTVKSDEVKKLMDETPISRDDLVSILKSRNITREELIQILREWEDPSVNKK